MAFRPRVRSRSSRQRPGSREITKDRGQSNNQVETKKVVEIAGITVLELLESKGCQI